MEMKGIKKLIKEKKRFLLTTHVHPDPDALCSELVLADFLKSKGRDVVIINADPVPRRLMFLPGVKMIRQFRETGRYLFDAVIVLDCGDWARIGAVKKLISPEIPVVNMDHHITNHAFGHFNLVDPEASSTAEQVYKFLHRTKYRLTKKTAMLLYIGLMTDTGSFRYDNTSPYTHKIAADLLQFGFSPNDLYKRLYETIPLTDLEHFTKVVSGFESYKDGRLICLELRRSILKKFSDDFDLREKIFRYLREIKNVEVILILTEVNKRMTRVNLRSNGLVNVAAVASHFNGGGHRKASGCLVASDIEETRDKLVKEIVKSMNYKKGKA